VCTAFLDLCKAFYSLDHTILLDHLCKLGVYGNELTWFTNYLSNRLQRVKLNGDTSIWTSVQGRIPQGSALVPLLFLVYVNEMPSIVKYGKLLQFADNTMLICSGSDFDSVKMQFTHDLPLVFNWISTSRLQLNIEKSSVMWFTPKSLKNVSRSLTANNTQLKEVDHQKYLGIIVDKKLCWDN